MKSSINPLTSTPVSILLGALIIGFAILFAQGAIVFSKDSNGQTKVSFNQPGKQAALPQVAGVAAPAAPGQPPAPVPGTKVDVSAGHFSSKGKDGAKVQIVEFADFQCPFCEKFFKDTETQIIKDYVDTGKATFAFRSYAFLGQESTWASEAAECANEQGKFWEYHDYLYSHQGPENSGAFAKDKLEGFAGAVGLNAVQFKDCLETDKYAQKVKDDMSDGQKVGVNGTPATFVNGILISGAQPYANFQSAIDAALK